MMAVFDENAASQHEDTISTRRSRETVGDRNSRS